MADTTISVSEQTLERFKSLKADLDEREERAPDHTAETFMRCLLDTYENQVFGAESDRVPEAAVDDIDTEEISEQLDVIKTQLENMSLTLDASERSKIAQEVQEALR